MELSWDKSCRSAGNYQVDEQAAITQLSWQLSSRCAVEIPVTQQALITWLITRLSFSDKVPQQAIGKELSRHESRNQQAIIIELSWDESCSSADQYQADEQAGITQLSWQLSSR